MLFTKRNKITKSTLLVSGLFCCSVAIAQNFGNHDGGLMKEMQNALHPPKIIINNTTQGKLHNVKIVENSDKNGGLMKEMMTSRYPEKIINEPGVQEKLHKIDLGDTTHRVIK